MRMLLLVWVGMSLWASAGAVPPGVTELEARWLQGIWPVLTWSREAGLPLDVVVQPQPMPDAPPLAMAFVGGRCKLVLSMRGNAEVASTERRIDPDLLDITLELMAAHELGHCRRWINGTWHGVPAGFEARAPATLDPALREAWAEMQAVRREEGYADLVGLAWVQQHHPQHYARVHAWLWAERSNTALAGSHHDTRLWARLVQQGQTLGAGPMFQAADALWRAGLTGTE